MSDIVIIEFGNDSQRIFSTFKSDSELKRLRAWASMAGMTEILDVTSGKAYTAALAQKDWSSMATTASSYSRAIRNRIARIICDEYYGTFTHEETIFWEKYWNMMTDGFEHAIGCKPTF